jgi:hypothetical protein
MGKHKKVQYQGKEKHSVWDARFRLGWLLLVQFSRTYRIRTPYIYQTRESNFPL